MKKLRPNSNGHLRTAACTVSAAALMLGVSQAATVGINFTVNYSCCTGNYINYVNVPAFGIPASGWENLSPMGTGYGAPGCPLYYNITNVIDTTIYTPAGGFTALNPLPNGALTVAWGAPTANWSGFAGYNSGSAAQPKPSSGPPRGEAEVYAGFLRDGVNFGPRDDGAGNTCAGGADNNQPGWYVDVVGLKSVFTNHPFVIQLIGASDSMNTMTNAFVIDATHSSTQSVIYPNPHHYGYAGGSPWFRAIGGGLSQVTGVLDADHVQIIGNRAAHGGTIADGDDYNNASCLAGFIITDKPVVTMSPQPVAAFLHDTVNLRAIAAGVPPLNYQWRKNGVTIGGATSSTYSVADIVSSANYDVVVTNVYGSAISKTSTVAVDQISIAQTSGEIIISWNSPDATLQSADAVTGPYVDLGGTSPYTNDIPAIQQFYRYIRPAQAPNTIDSNPYDQ